MDEKRHTWRPWWTTGALGVIFGSAAALVLHSSEHGADVTRLLLLLVGWALAVLGFWCLLWFAVIEFIVIVDRTHPPNWILRVAVSGGFAALYLGLLLVIYRL